MCFVGHDERKNLTADYDFCCIQEEFDRVFSLNTRGQFFVAREAYRHLNEGGRIILTSSNTSQDFSVPNHSIYSGSKGAIDSFVRIMSKDAGKKKITVNAVAPGGTVTDMFHDVAHHYIPGGEKYSPEELQQVSDLDFQLKCHDSSKPIN
jgi:tetrahydroxynaphthalene reductase